MLYWVLLDITFFILVSFGYYRALECLGIGLVSLYGKVQCTI